MNRIKLITIAMAASALFVGEPVSATRGTATISVDPTVDRVIEGVAELDRNIYFSMSDAGSGFRKRCKSDERYAYLRDMQVTFGRQLGPVQAAVQWRNAVREDPERPGYADLDYLKEQLLKSTDTPDPRMVQDFGKLDIAAHGNHNAYPDFMEKYATADAQQGPHPEKIPANAEAAAELAAYVMAYGYNDFNRPVYFEPLNEPHWSYYGDQKLNEWHLKTMEKVHEIAPGVKVGGPCQSVSYMYSNSYKTFRNWCKFLDGTEGKMDFYSFHCYDYFGEQDGDFGGRITSGLPLEGVLDMIPNYTLNEYDRTYDIIISEHGGYELSGGEFVEKLAKKHFPGKGFTWEMKKRSIADFNAVTTFIANTMCFMNHPHTVKKAVPFILLESMGWDPTYYATLYAPRDYEDKDDWAPSRLIEFYKLFKDVEGRYVKILNNSPDIQSLALVHENKLFVLLNNLHNEKTSIALDIPRGPQMQIRRYGRSRDFTPYLKDEPLKSLEGFSLAGRESAVLIIEYGQSIPARRVIQETAFYSDKVAVAIPSGSEAFTINLPEERQIDYAVLRVSFVRPADRQKQVDIKLNGKKLDVPIERCADRLAEEDKDYATTRLIPVDPAMLQPENEIRISFRGGGKASVGSVVIRAGLKKQ